MHFQNDLRDQSRVRLIKPWEFEKKE